MHDTETLVPARDLVATNKAHYPNETAEYRAARDLLLTEEIELRRQLERVASRAGSCRQAARFRRISISFPRLALRRK